MKIVGLPGDGDCDGDGTGSGAMAATSKHVTIVHKANFLKIAQGMFIDILSGLTAEPGTRKVGLAF
jgi:hypothetical protein